MAEFYYTCLECIWKHLRDAEHHMEDAMTEAESKSNKGKVLFFSALKEKSRQLRKHFSPDFKIDMNCTTCNPNPRKYLCKSPTGDCTGSVKYKHL